MVSIQRRRALILSPITNFEPTPSVIMGSPLGRSFNQTDVTKVPVTQQLSSLSPAPILFDRVNAPTFEEGTPSQKYVGSVDWSEGPFGSDSTGTYYGKVVALGPAQQPIWSETCRRWLT